MFRGTLELPQVEFGKPSDRPRPSGLDAVCTFHHFAIITYAVDEARLRELVPRRFELQAVPIHDRQMGLLSVVSLKGVDFTSAVFPSPGFTLGQVNYRIYIRDQVTGEPGVWFLGSIVDSWARIVPRMLWKLPWFGGEVDIDSRYDQAGKKYKSYRMKTTSEWAPADVTLTQNEEDVLHFPGFPDTETALVLLTHPLIGFYRRLDGKLCKVRVWHQRLNVRPGRLCSARFDLLTRLSLVSAEKQQKPYSVLIDRCNEFTIYLPPEVLA